MQRIRRVGRQSSRYLFGVYSLEVREEKTRGPATIFLKGDMQFLLCKMGINLCPISLLG